MQGLGISWQTLAGVQDPIQPARMFIADPLRATAGHDRALQDALATWRATPARQQSAWAQAYASAAAKVRFTRRGAPLVPPGRYGPVPVLMAAELTLAQARVFCKMTADEVRKELQLSDDYRLTWLEQAPAAK